MKWSLVCGTHPYFEVLEVRGLQGPVTDLDSHLLETGDHIHGAWPCSPWHS